MATSAPEDRPLVEEVLSGLGPDELFQAETPRRSRLGKGLAAVVAVFAVAGLAAAGYATLNGAWQGRTADSFLTHTVARGELLVTVTEDGNLESAQNEDIKCEVAGGSTILWIVEDGKEVEQGAELVRLDSSQLEDQINQQRIVYEKARATYIQAQKDFEVAKISVQEYIEGTYRQEMETIEANITIAKANLTSAENSLQHTERMFRKGYVTPLQLETQQFAVERAKLDLAAANTAKDVLERFTKVKMLQDLESKRDTAEAKANSEKAAFDLEEARLKRLETQLQKCVIHAPKAGMVVYANEQGRGRFPGQQTTEIKEGTVVREQQSIIRLPDLSNMQVKVTVHESKVDRVRRGMRARVRVQDRDFQGTVVAVANQPEPGSFWSAAVKEYATTVKIDGQSKALRPGLTAEVEILVAALPDVLSVPVAAVFQQRGQEFCVVKTGSGVEKRAVELGMTNDKSVEIKQGLKEGEQVVLNPRAVLPEMTEQSREPEAVDVNERFGRGAGAPTEEPGKRGPPGEPKAAEPRGGPPPGPPGEGRPSQAPEGGPRPPSGGERKGRMDLMQFDKDGDGRVSREEAPEQMQTFFVRMDANGDGFIDKAEIDAARSRFEVSGGRKPPAPNGERGP